MIFKHIPLPLCQPALRRGTLWVTAKSRLPVFHRLSPWLIAALPIPSHVTHSLASTIVIFPSGENFIPRGIFYAWISGRATHRHRVPMLFFWCRWYETHLRNWWGENDQIALRKLFCKIGVMRSTRFDVFFENPVESKRGFETLKQVSIKQQLGTASLRHRHAF